MKDDLSLMWTCFLADQPNLVVEDLLMQFRISKRDGLDLKKRIVNGVDPWPILEKSHDERDLMHLSDKINLQFLIEATECITNKQFDNLRDQAVSLGILHSPPDHLVRGQDLFDKGLRGPEIGQMMATLRKLQLDGVLSSKKNALMYVDKRHVDASE